MIWLRNQCNYLKGLKMVRLYRMWVLKRCFKVIAWMRKDFTAPIQIIERIYEN